MSEEDHAQHPFSSINIEASNANVSVAEDTAVVINVRSTEDESDVPHSQREVRIPRTEEESINDSFVSVTGGTSSGNRNLHFFVHNQEQYIQIGQCCVVIEIHVNDKMLERLRAQGTLQVDSQIGDSLITLRWKGLEIDEAELRARLKVQLQLSLKKSVQDIERKILQDLVANQCEKCQRLVTFFLKEVGGYLENISTGCIQFTLKFINKEDFQRCRSSEAITKIQKFFEELLLPDFEKNKFPTFIIKVVDVADQNYASDYNVNRQEEKDFVSWKQSEPSSSGVSKFGEKTLDQFTEQIGQVKQSITSITEELSVFRQEQPQILRDALVEMLPEMEQIIYENISTKQVAGFSSSQESERLSKELPTSLSKQTQSTIEFDGSSPKPISAYRRANNPMMRKDARQVNAESSDYRDESDKKNYKGYRNMNEPIPVTVKKYDTELNESLSESEEDKEIIDLVSFAHYKIKRVLPDVKVKQRSQPLDFSHLFNAIQENRDESGQGIDEVCLDPQTSGHHEMLKDIWGKKTFMDVQQALLIANKAITKLDDCELSDRFCTVLCVDLSQNMAGQPHKRQASVAQKIIQGSLGYIGVISIGDETKLEQELTRDKDLALKVIDQLQIEPFNQGSNSSVIQGLFTALKLLHNRVKPTDYGPHYTLYPKIVIMSDGLFNDSKSDQQPCQTTWNILTSVLEVLVAMDIKIPIYFVPVGKKLQLSPKCLNMLSVVLDVDFLSDSEVKETFIGRTLNAIMRPDKPQTPFKSWQIIKKELKREHTIDIKQIEWFITEHFKHPPPIGTRVKMEFLAHLTGTVLCHIQGQIEKQTGKLMVALDREERVLCSWNFDQKALLFYKPSSSSNISDISVGTLVKKGRKFGKRDLDLYNFGVAIKSGEADTVKVCWRSGLYFGSIGSHHKSELITAEYPLTDLAGMKASRKFEKNATHDEEMENQHRYNKIKGFKLQLDMGSIHQRSQESGRSCVERKNLADSKMKILSF